MVGWTGGVEAGVELRQVLRQLSSSTQIQFCKGAGALLPQVTGQGSPWTGLQSVAANLSLNCLCISD